MNTADRSIKLLDSALRRRFAFVELMPKPSLLQGGKIGGLLLDDFLEALNERIARKEGREKQIGHSFLMDRDGPISEQEEFARRFRQKSCLFSRNTVTTIMRYWRTTLARNLSIRTEKC